MKVFKISIKLQEDGKWSQQEFDFSGYFIKESEESDTVEGYLKLLYHTTGDNVRYIKGLYDNNSIVFLQMCNNYSLSPICYCFPNTNKPGFWSDFNYMLGFFPVYPSRPCSKGRALVRIEEVTGENLNIIAKETASIFDEKSSEAISLNQDLMDDAHSLSIFLKPSSIFQMHMHCGKW